MNIRLDDDVRIRLSSEDVSRLNETMACEKHFAINGIEILAAFVRLGGNTAVNFSVADRTLEIHLSQADFQRLMAPESMRDGIDLGGIKLQVDIFKSRKSAGVDLKVKARE